MEVKVNLQDGNARVEKGFERSLGEVSPLRVSFEGRLGVLRVGRAARGNSSKSLRLKVCSVWWQSFGETADRS